MSESNQQTLATIGAQGEGTIIAFYKTMASELGGPSRHVLNLLARALAERGWLTTVPALIAQEVESGETEAHVRAADEDLVRRRLLELDAAGERIVGLLGSVSVARTPHRGHLANGVDIFTHGGADLLALNTLFQRPVDAFTSCGQCQADVSFRMEDGAIVSLAPTGAAGYQANWDGSSPLADTSSASPMLCSDACLAAWQETHPDCDGLPLASDTLLFIGTMMANEAGGARFTMVSVDG